MIYIRFLLNLNLFQQNVLRRTVVTYFKLKMAANWLPKDFFVISLLFMKTFFIVQGTISLYIGT